MYMHKAFYKNIGNVYGQLILKSPLPSSTLNDRDWADFNSDEKNLTYHVTLPMAHFLRNLRHFQEIMFIIYCNMSRCYVSHHSIVNTSNDKPLPLW